jgi:glutamyl-Q tRNA(Asp) synthetase
MLEQAVCQWNHTPLQGKQRIEVDSLQNLLAIP